MSYSSERGHSDWVRMLAERLTSNGIHVVFDQWDVQLGDDLPHFMETGLTGADRVICVCSSSYVSKANSLSRGVGYEKKIMSAELTRQADSSKIVPLLRDVQGEALVPTFLAGARYIDFRDDAAFEDSYRELTFDLYGRRLYARPALGTSPFSSRSDVLAEIDLRNNRTTYGTADSAGEAVFAYENNNGRFTLGSGAQRFVLHVTGAGDGSFYIYNEDVETHAVALAVDTSLAELADPLAYDMSSRYRLVQVGDVAIIVNSEGHVAAIEPLQVTTRDSDPEATPRLHFRFATLR